MALIPTPASAIFNALGGACDIQLKNSGNTKLAFKVKCSNNANYRTTPVYGFVDPNGTAVIKITRSAGTVKDDKLVVQYGAAPPGATNPATVPVTSLDKTLTISLIVNIANMAPQSAAVPTNVSSPIQADSTRQGRLYFDVDDQKPQTVAPNAPNAAGGTPPAFKQEIVVPAAGGTFEHKLNNATGDRFVFKVKSSNNANYRILPVFGFVEPFGSFPLKVTRTPGPPKKDKLVVHFGNAPPNVNEPSAAFAQAIGPIQKITIPLCAV